MLKPFQTHSEDFLSFRHDLYEKMGKKPTCRNLSHIGGSKPIFIPSPVPKKNTTIQHGPFRALSIRYWLQSIWGKHFWFQCFFNIKYWFQSPWCYFSILICLLGLKSKPKINIKINIFPMFPLVSPFPFGPQTLQHQPPPLEGCMHKFHGKVLSFAKDQDPFSRISSITPFFKGCPFSRDALSQGPLATYPFARVLSFCKDQCWYLSLSQGMSKELQG